MHKTVNDWFIPLSESFLVLKTAAFTYNSNVLRGFVFLLELQGPVD